MVGLILGIVLILLACVVGIVWSYKKYRMRQKDVAAMTAAKQGDSEAHLAVQDRSMPGLVQNPISGNSLYLTGDEQRHTLFTCKKCGMKPIRGIRFSCSTCEHDL